MPKRVISIVLILILTFTFIACSRGEKDTDVLDDGKERKGDFYYNFNIDRDIIDIFQIYSIMKFSK